MSNGVYRNNMLTTNYMLFYRVLSEDGVHDSTTKASWAV